MAKKNKLKSVLCAGLALVAVGGVAVTTYHFKDQIKDKIEDIFDKDNDKPIDNVEDTSPIVDGTTSNEDVVKMPQNITFKKMANSSQITVRGTVNEDATIKTLTWSTFWETNTSGNVSDYVTITPSSDTLTCSITVKQGFNTPIILTATTVDGASANCKLDFLKMATNITLSIERYLDGGQYEKFTSYFSTDYATMNFDNVDSDRGLSDGLFEWNSSNANSHKYYIDSYCGSEPSDLDEIHFIDTSYETIGTIGNVNVTNDYFTFALSSETKTALTNAGFSRFIKDRSFDGSGEIADGNYLFNNWFGLDFSSGCSASDFTTIVNIISQFEYNSVVSGNVYRVLNGTTLATQNINIKVDLDLLSYIPANVSLDNSTTVLK